MAWTRCEQTDRETDRQTDGQTASQGDSYILPNFVYEGIQNLKKIVILHTFGGYTWVDYPFQFESNFYLKREKLYNILIHVPIVTEIQKRYENNCFISLV